MLQHTVEVLSLLSDDVETDDASPGENLKLRLKGIEEEEILPGFILCSPDNLCHSGRTFDAQVKRVINYGEKLGIKVTTCDSIWFQQINLGLSVYPFAG